MTQSLKTQRLSSYATRMATWTAQLRTAVIQACVQVAALTAILLMLRIYLDRTKGSVISWPEWIGLSLAFAVVTVIPVIYVKIGPRPRPEDVESDRALRRAFGMDDTIEGDSER